MNALLIILVVLGITAQHVTKKIYNQKNTGGAYTFSAISVKIRKSVKKEEGRAPCQARRPPLWGKLTLDELEVVAGVLVADTAHDAAEHLAVVRVLTVINPGADQVAEDAAEVLVAGVGNEAAEFTMRAAPSIQNLVAKKNGA